MKLDLGLLMDEYSGEYSREGVKQSVEVFKEIISDLENMDISTSEIFEKLEKRTGRSAKEFERDIRIQFSESYREFCGILERILLETENN